MDPSTCCRITDPDNPFPHCVIDPTLVNRYGPATLMGNWYEEFAGRETLCEEHYVKKSCNQLLTQNSQTMLDELFKPVELSAVSDKTLRYGNVIQIIHPGPDCCDAEESFPAENHCEVPPPSNVALSSSIPLKRFDCSPWLDVDADMSASQFTCPVLRNSYIIEHPECPDLKDEVLCYGNPFRLRVPEGKHKHPLYLHAAPAIKFVQMAKNSGQGLVRLSDCRNTNTLWTCSPKNPELQMRVPLGIPVTTNTLVNIKHTISGHCLCLEEKYPVLKYFGCELEVSVCYKPAHRNRKKMAWQTYWTFQSQLFHKKDEDEDLESTDCRRDIDKRYGFKPPTSSEQTSVEALCEETYKQN